MTLKHTPCFYHPDRIAISVCSRCRRPICLDDKNIYDYNNRFNGPTMGTSYNPRDYCPACYSSLVNTKLSTAPMIVVLIFFSSFFFFVFGIFSLAGITESSPFVVNSLLIFFAIVLFLSVFIFIVIEIMSKSTNQKIRVNKDHINEINYQERKLERFNENDFEDQLSKKSIQGAQKNTIVSCYQCGSYLTLNDKFCPICGDSTKEELSDYYKIKKN